jgi:hypothetical protein
VPQLDAVRRYVCERALQPSQLDVSNRIHLSRASLN